MKPLEKLAWGTIRTFADLEDENWKINSKPGKEPLRYFIYNEESGIEIYEPKEDRHHDLVVLIKKDKDVGPVDSQNVDYIKVSSYEEGLDTIDRLKVRYCPQKLSWQLPSIGGIYVGAKVKVIKLPQPKWLFENYLGNIYTVQDIDLKAKKIGLPNITSLDGTIMLFPVRCLQLITENKLLGSQKRAWKLEREMLYDDFNRDYLMKGEAHDGIIFTGRDLHLNEYVLYYISPGKGLDELIPLFELSGAIPETKESYKTLEEASIAGRIYASKHDLLYVISKIEEYNIGRIRSSLNTVSWNIGVSKLDSGDRVKYIGKKRFLSPPTRNGDRYEINYGHLGTIVLPQYTLPGKANEVASVLWDDVPPGIDYFTGEETGYQTSIDLLQPADSAEDPLNLQSSIKSIESNESSRDSKEFNKNLTYIEPGNLTEGSKVIYIAEAFNDLNPGDKGEILSKPFWDEDEKEYWVDVRWDKQGIGIVVPVGDLVPEDKQKLSWRVSPELAELMSGEDVRIVGDVNKEIEELRESLITGNSAFRESPEDLERMVQHVKDTIATAAGKIMKVDYRTGEVKVLYDNQGIVITVPYDALVKVPNEKLAWQISAERWKRSIRKESNTRIIVEYVLVGIKGEIITNTRPPNPESEIFIKTVPQEFEVVSEFGVVHFKIAPYGGVVLNWRCEAVFYYKMVEEDTERITTSIEAITTDRRTLQLNIRIALNDIIIAGAKKLREILPKQLPIKYSPETGQWIKQSSLGDTEAIDKLSWQLPDNPFEGMIIKYQSILFNGVYNYLLPTTVTKLGAGSYLISGKMSRNIEDLKETRRINYIKDMIYIDEISPGVFARASTKLEQGEYKTVHTPIELIPVEGTIASKLAWKTEESFIDLVDSDWEFVDVNGKRGIRHGRYLIFEPYQILNNVTLAPKPEYYINLFERTDLAGRYKTNTYSEAIDLIKQIKDLLEKRASKIASVPYFEEGQIVKFIGGIGRLIGIPENKFLRQANKTAIQKILETTTGNVLRSDGQGNYEVKYATPELGDFNLLIPGYLLQDVLLASKLSWQLPTTIEDVHDYKGWLVEDALDRGMISYGVVEEVIQTSRGGGKLYAHWEPTEEKALQTYKDTQEPAKYCLIIDPDEFNYVLRIQYVGEKEYPSLGDLFNRPQASQKLSWQLPTTITDVHDYKGWLVEDSLGGTISYGVVEEVIVNITTGGGELYAHWEPTEEKALQSYNNLSPARFSISVTPDDFKYVLRIKYVGEKDSPSLGELFNRPQASQKLSWQTRDFNTLQPQQGMIVRVVNREKTGPKGFIVGSSGVILSASPRVDHIVVDFFPNSKGRSEQVRRGGRVEFSRKQLAFYTEFVDMMSRQRMLQDYRMEFLPGDRVEYTSEQPAKYPGDTIVKGDQGVVIEGWYSAEEAYTTILWDKREVNEDGLGSMAGTKLKIIEPNPKYSSIDKLSWQIFDFSILTPQQGMQVRVREDAKEVPQGIPRGTLGVITEASPYANYYIVRFIFGTRDESIQFSRDDFRLWLEFVKMLSRQELSQKYNMDFLPGDRVEYTGQEPAVFSEGNIAKGDQGVIAEGSKAENFNVVIWDKKEINGDGMGGVEGDNLKIIEPNPRYAAKKEKSDFQKRLGQCYVLSYRYVTSHLGEDNKLVHGTITSKDGVNTVDHAWVEKPNGDVYDPVLDWELPKEAYYGFMTAKPEVEYTARQAMQKGLEFGHYGHWHKGDLGKKATVKSGWINPTGQYIKVGDQQHGQVLLQFIDLLSPELKSQFNIQPGTIQGVPMGVIEDLLNEAYRRGWVRVVGESSRGEISFFVGNLTTKIKSNIEQWLIDNQVDENQKMRVEKITGYVPDSIFTGVVSQFYSTNVTASILAWKIEPKFVPSSDPPPTDYPESWVGWLVKDSEGDYGVVTKVEQHIYGAELGDPVSAIWKSTPEEAVAAYFNQYGESILDVPYEQITEFYKKIVTSDREGQTNIAEAGLNELREVIKIQNSDGNWNYDEYMRGMANGLILADSVVSDSTVSPEFFEEPEDGYLEDKPKKKEIMVKEKLSWKLPGAEVLTTEEYEEKYYDKEKQEWRKGSAWAIPSYHTDIPGELLYLAVYVPEGEVLDTALDIPGLTEKGYSLEDIIDIINDFCKERNYVHVISDVEEMGLSDFNRNNRLSWKIAPEPPAKTREELEEMAQESGKQVGGICVRPVLEGDTLTHITVACEFLPNSEDGEIVVFSTTLERGFESYGEALERAKEVAVEIHYNLYVTEYMRDMNNRRLAWKLPEESLPTPKYFDIDQVDSPQKAEEWISRQDSIAYDYTTNQFVRAYVKEHVVLNNDLDLAVSAKNRVVAVYGAEDLIEDKFMEQIKEAWEQCKNNEIEIAQTSTGAIHADWRNEVNERNLSVLYRAFKFIPLPEVYNSPLYRSVKDKINAMLQNQIETLTYESPIDSFVRASNLVTSIVNYQWERFLKGDMEQRLLQIAQKLHDIVPAGPIDNRKKEVLEYVDKIIAGLLEAFKKVKYSNKKSDKGLVPKYSWKVNLKKKLSWKITPETPSTFNLYTSRFDEVDDLVKLEDWLKYRGDEITEDLLATNEFARSYILANLNFDPALLSPYVMINGNKVWVSSSPYLKELLEDRHREKYLSKWEAVKDLEMSDPKVDVNHFIGGASMGFPTEGKVDGTPLHPDIFRWFRGIIPPEDITNSNLYKSTLVKLTSLLEEHINSLTPQSDLAAYQVVESIVGAVKNSYAYFFKGSSSDKLPGLIQKVYTALPPSGDQYKDPKIECINKITRDLFELLQTARYSSKKVSWKISEAVLYKLSGKYDFYYIGIDTGEIREGKHVVKRIDSLPFDPAEGREETALTNIKDSFTYYMEDTNGILEDLHKYFGYTYEEDLVAESDIVLKYTLPPGLENFLREGSKLSWKLEPDWAPVTSKADLARGMKVKLKPGASGAWWFNMADEYKLNVFNYPEVSHMSATPISENTIGTVESMGWSPDNVGVDWEGYPRTNQGKGWMVEWDSLLMKKDTDTNSKLSWKELSNDYTYSINGQVEDKDFITICNTVKDMKQSGVTDISIYRNYRSKSNPVMDMSVYIYDENGWIYDHLNDSEKDILQGSVFNTL